MYEIIAMQRPKEPERNGHSNGNGNGHHHPEPVAAVVPKIEAPQADPFKDFSDVQIFAAALSRAMAAVGKMEAMEKRVKDLEANAEESFKLLSEENAAITERARALTLQVEELKEKITGLSAEAGQVRFPRVAIVGCRKDVFDMISSAAAERGMKLEFRHYEQEHSKVVPVFADYAIILPGLSHAQHAKAVEGVPRGQSAFLPKFSVSQAIAQLQVWFQPEVAAAL